MVYAIREFVRNRKSFSVGIAKSYFNLLRLQDRLTNSLNNYENLRDERIRAEFMAQAGRTPEFQVDQQRQSELSARDSWIRSQQSYSNALDEFKITLGLPTEVLLEPDPQELKDLSVEIDRVGLDQERAIVTALAGRLDFVTVQDRLTDAERRVEVAIDRLKPRLDIGGSYTRDTPETQPLNFRDGEDVFRGQADLELPLDRKSERNSYRQSLIQLASARRNVQEQEDRIRLEVRNAFRNLDQAEESYRIQMNSLRLAERRVESTTLLQQAGRANTRDVLDAREALLDAQNSVTQAVVDHFNTRLDLSLAMETLRVDDRGFWVGSSLAGAGQGGAREN
jgi:outer membrane protein TolC